MLPSPCQISWSLLELRVVWGLLTQQRHWIAVVSWADLHCELVFVPHLRQSRSLVSGSMAGNTTSGPLSNTISGRPQLLPSHLLRTRPICDFIQDQEPVQSCAEHPHDRSSHCSRGCSELWSLRDCGCLSRSRNPIASVALVRTRWDTTGELVPGQGGCNRGQWHQRGHCQNLPGRRVLCDRT